jgi:nucleotide-binding universal stress UspA family protein
VRNEIVVGVDGSENSREALRWAVEYASLVGATVVAIAAWEYPAVGDVSGMIAMPGPDILGNGAEAILEDTIAQAQLPAGVAIERKVIQGQPAGTLVEHGDESLLLVVGRRGHGGFLGLLTGSVATQCANHSRVPVVVVPHRDDE